MMVIDTAYHVSFDEASTKPTQACTGRCKKAFWPDLLKEATPGQCPACGGTLCDAVEKVHFTVLSSANRPLKLSDFEQFTKVTHADKVFMKNFLVRGAISHMSIVKPKFVAKAKAEWCS